MERWIRKIVAVMPIILLSGACLAQDDLGVANYNAEEQLVFPENAVEWVFMGAALGSDYSDEPMSQEDPGLMGVVQMEPSAYRYFLENKEYADGTMFLLTFYQGETQSEPQLQGIVQGDAVLQEIHVIDSQRFNEGRGFFQFRPSVQAPSTRIADGSECVACHSEHGDFNGTFVQFYPVIRAHIE